MTNAVIAYGNQADVAALSGGSWTSSLPLANLQDRRLGRVARTSNLLTASTKFDADFGGTRLFRTIALVNHNLSLSAQYRIRLSTAADFSTSVADTGWLGVWPTVYPLGSLPWGSPSWWSGRYSAEEVAGYTGALIYVLPTSTNARYLRVEFNDAGNADGYLDLGRLFAADGWQPTRNMVYGASLAWEDPSEIQEALSGAEYFNERSKRRVARFGLEAMTENEALARAFDVQHQVGVTKEVLFVWDPGDSTHSLRRRFLGRLRTLSAIENPGPDRWRTPFEIKELL